MTRLYRRSRASRDAAMWAAVARDQRAEVSEKPWSVAAADADEARDARNHDRARYVRVGGAVLDENDVPAEADR